MKGPLCYVGGKNRFVSKILPLIPEHTTYVEPFAGGAQIFFQKPVSKVEVLMTSTANWSISTVSANRTMKSCCAICASWCRAARGI